MMAVGHMYKKRLVAAFFGGVCCFVFATTMYNLVHLANYDIPLEKVSDNKSYIANDSR